MKKWYLLFLLPVVAMLVMALYPHTGYDYKGVVALTKVSEPAYGVFWHEPRIRLFQKAHYIPYPEMPSCDRLRFVYRLTPKERVYASK